MIEADALFTGGCLVTMNEQRDVVDCGAVAVAGGHIVALGAAAALADQVHAAQVIDCTDQIILPGLVDVHAHAGHGLIKSIGMHNGNRWEEICGEIYTQASDAAFWFAEARLAALERLRFGVTTGVSLLGGGDTIMRTDDPAYAKAHCDGVLSVGARSVVAVGPTRAPHPIDYAHWNSGTRTTFPVRFEQQFETCKHIFEEWHGKADDTIRIAMLYPVLRDEHERDMAPEDYAAACAQSQAVRQFAKDKGAIFTQDGHWRGSVLRAHELGLLGPQSLLSHCIDLHDDEIALIAETGTKVAHNPSANASISGRCPAIELMAQGATVALCSDATAPDRSADMFRHMQQAMHYHRKHFQDADVLPIGQTLEMCTIGGARALGMEADIGSLEIGKRADIITVDLRRPHLFPPNMPLHRLVCFANGNDVSNVMVGGAMVLEDGRATQVHEDEILADAARQCAVMLQRIGGGQADMALPDDFWGREATPT